MEPITLRSGPLAVVLAPSAGGAIARFWSEARGAGLDLLRPASAESLARGDPWGMASFPLVPWSNRIREGRFAFGGRAVALPANHPAHRHAIHGHGWAAAWAVVEATPDTGVLEYRHAPGAWPWAYRAAQRIVVSPRDLALELVLTNEGDEAMPAGLGWHPYFPRTAKTTLTARVRGRWHTDREILPVAHRPPSPECDPSRGLRVSEVALDDVFTDWDGHAVVAWPEREASLTITTGPPLGCLVVYTPPRESFFCAEPVSHVTDAFNLAAAGRADTGMLILAPGEAARAAVRVVPEIG